MEDLGQKAVSKLEESGFLRKIRSELNAEVIGILAEMEEKGELPEKLQLKRFTPNEDEALELSYIAEFLNHHNLTNTLRVLQKEIKGEIMQIRGMGELSELALLLTQYEESKKMNG